MVKVETVTDEKTGITEFRFEAQNPEDLATLDKLRVAFLGEHPRRGGYAGSNRLVIETKVPTDELKIF